MPQFLADISQNKFTLSKEESRHLSVLRFKEGQEIKIFDGKGKKFKGTLQSISNSSACGLIVSEIPPKKPLRDIRLCFCVISRAAAEELLDICTQIGVSSFQPVISRYTEKDFIKKWQTKESRWEQIILAACKQCEASVLPVILPPITFAEAVKSPMPAIICYEDEALKTVSQAVADLNNPSALSIHIGPEGGYSLEEVSLAKANNIIPVSLGVNILRAQTAALAAAAKAL